MHNCHINNFHKASRKIGNILISFDMKYEIAFYKERKLISFVLNSFDLRSNLKKHSFVFTERCFLKRCLEMSGCQSLESSEIHGVAAVSLIEKRADTRHI